MIFLIIGILLAAAGFAIFIVTTKESEVAMRACLDNKEKAQYWLDKSKHAEEEYNDYHQESLRLYGEIGALSDSLETMKAQADDSIKSYHDTIYNAMVQNFDEEAAKESEYYQKQIEEYKQHYQQVLADMSADIVKQGQTAKQIAAEIDDLKSKQNAAVEANKRSLEMETKQDFYRLNIPNEDLLEIKKLREIMPYLRDKVTLNKVIYKIYYENPTNDLIGRVVGNKTCGIYKITNILNGMCYVGQTVNFADRWKQHIKRGVGADPITQNKLYPAMQKDGVQNFTFEIIEECPQSKLNEREQYWQDFFEAKKFGYSIR